MLSTRVEISAIERIAFHKALVKIAGEDVGKTHSAWRRWLNAREEEPETGVTK